MTHRTKCKNSATFFSLFKTFDHLKKLTWVCVNEKIVLVALRLSPDVHSPSRQSTSVYERMIKLYEEMIRKKFFSRQFVEFEK